MVRLKQFMADQVWKAFPRISKFYTMQRLVDLTHLHFNEKIFKRGKILQRQDSSSDSLLLIISGKVGIFKNLEYFNENDKLETKTSMIMELSTSEIIGEDPVWYKRPC